MWIRHGLPVFLATLAGVGFAACSSSGRGMTNPDGEPGADGANTANGATSAVGTPSGGGATGVDGLASAFDAPGGATSTGGVSGGGGTAGASGCTRVCPDGGTPSAYPSCQCDAMSTGGANGGNPPTNGSFATGGTTSTATGTQDGGGCEELAVIAVCIDGSDWLHIQGATGWFTHGSYDAAGAHPDCVALGMSGVVTVNGTNTSLAWPNGDGAGQPSSTFALPLAVPTVDGTLSLTPVQARGGLSVTTNPSSADGYDGDIFVDDSAISGAAVYDFKISWCSGGSVTGAGSSPSTGGTAGSGGATGSGGAASAGGSSGTTAECTPACSGEAACYKNTCCTTGQTCAACSTAYPFFCGPESPLPNSCWNMGTATAVNCASAVQCSDGSQHVCAGVGYAYNCATSTCKSTSACAKTCPAGQTLDTVSCTCSSNCTNICPNGGTPTGPACLCPTCSNFCTGGGTPTYPLCLCPTCSNFCTGGGTPTYPLCLCPTPICTRTCPPGHFLNSFSCTCS